MKYLLPFLLLLPACGPNGSDVAVDSQLTQAAAERWWDQDAPELFGEPVEKHLDRLPVQGRATHVPWAGYYWPLFQDGINYQWAGAGTESAAAKYQRAFGGWRVEDLVSMYHGVDSLKGKWCFNNNMCGYGGMCARRAGRKFGRCMPLWYGICQAWAAAAILHPEPRHAVQYNGVVFAVTDLKALLSVLYAHASVREVSLRCERHASQIVVDETGRPIEIECRDSNPGTYHLLLTNYLGLKGKAFVEDRDMTRDVWNQPLSGFQILEMHEATQQEANAALGNGNSNYPYNADAERFVYVKTRVDYIKEAAPQWDGFLGDIIHKFTFNDVYEYILELNRDGEIIGGEWAFGSKMNHPDFLWMPTGEDADSAAGGSITAANVMMLVNGSYE